MSSIVGNARAIINQGIDLFKARTSDLSTSLTKENINQIRSSLNWIATASAGFSIFCLFYFPKSIPFVSRSIRSIGYVSAFITYEIERVNHYALAQLQLNLLLNERSSEKYIEHCENEIDKTITVRAVMKLCTCLKGNL